MTLESVATTAIAVTGNAQAAVAVVPGAEVGVALVLPPSLPALAAIVPGIAPPIGSTPGTVASGDDPRFSDTREWTAATVSQAEAEAGTATTRRAWTAQRVFQAIAAWWAASAAATKLAGIAAGATANATDAQLRDRATHTGTQAASTITGLAAVATSGAYGDLSGRPGVVTTSTAGLQPATSYAAITYGATVNLDLEALAGQVRTLTLTGHVIFTTSNRAAGRSVTLRLIAGAAQRNLTFPVEWPFVSPKPASLAANKVAYLTIDCFGTAETDIVAAYSAQP